MNRPAAVAATTSPLLLASTVLLAGGSAFIFVLPLFVMAVILGTFIFKSHYITIENKEKKALKKKPNAPVSYYDHKTDSIVDYDPTAEIVDENWHENLINPPALAKAIVDKAEQYSGPNLVILPITETHRTKGLKMRGTPFTDKDGGISALFDFTNVQTNNAYTAEELFDACIKISETQYAPGQELDHNKDYVAWVDKNTNLIHRSYMTNFSAKAEVAKPKPVVKQKYGHKIYFLEEVKNQIPKAPKGTRWSLSTEIQKEVEWRFGKREREGFDDFIENDINDAIATLKLVDSETLELLNLPSIPTELEKNISGYHTSTNNFSVNLIRRTFKEGFDMGDHMAEYYSKKLLKEFVDFAKTAVNRFDQINNPPEVESYII